MTVIETLDEQLNLRVPSWLKAAVENDALARSQQGQRVTAADVARETLWQRFEHARPKPEPVEAST